jgi:hypothetical protein
MVIEPNEEQRRIFDLQGCEMNLEKQIKELRAEVERLRAENETMRQQIHFCSGSCRLPDDAAKIRDILESWGFRPNYEN